MPAYMQCIAHAIDNRAALLSMACAEVCTLCGGVEVYVQDSVEVYIGCYTIVYQHKQLINW